MNIYLRNSRRPHTVINNIIKEYGFNNTYPLINLVKKINYFSLLEVDYALLRLFILSEIADKNEFTIDDVNAYRLKNNIMHSLNWILLTNSIPEKKSRIIKFLKNESYDEQQAIYFLNLEKSKNVDFQFIINFCEI